MLNETTVTLQGWLGGDVTVRDAAGSEVASFRVASTPRRFHRGTGEWVDGVTQWYTVNAWRTLARTCATSLRRGDPVVVHGRLLPRVWTNQAGVEVTTIEVDAVLVGHDLTRGTSVFTRTPRQRSADPSGPVAQEAPGAGDAGHVAA
ncbi:single-stranded DNA-binding protein [uncultured Nocardioides sp.]|jgi:single-strand DNA-binding protein